MSTDHGNSSLPRDRPSPLAGLSLELPERGTGARAARRAAREGRPPEAGGEPEATPSGRPSAPSRRWLAGFAAALVVCLVAATGLALFGLSTLRESRVGRTVTRATPDEPGFEAFLEPTPTMAVAVVDGDQLEGVAVLALGADAEGGAVLVIPPDTLLGPGLLTLRAVHEFGAGNEELRASIERVAGVGITELAVLDDARLVELVAPVAPVVVENPDPLADFEVGQIELAAEDIGPYLRATRRNENELARMVRHESFWSGWLAQVAAAGPGAVPGEVEVGLGSFVRGLAAGAHVVQTMPVNEVPTDDGAADFEVDAARRAAMITVVVPYPSGTIDAPRTLVRLLDGTGDHEHVARVAPAVVAADASIVVVGNADRFDYERTQVRYHRPEHRAAAERLQQALGAGEVIEDVRPIDSFDVTIVLGTDL